jgi:limonene-1,2-epoxide hydrolase
MNVPAASPKEILILWLAAFNNGDVDAITGLYAPYATNHQVAKEPIVGQKAIRAMFEQEFATAGMVCIPDNIFEDGEWAILEWYDPKGLRGCGFFHVIDGKIVYQRGYWDMLSFQRLHGTSSENPDA